MPPTKTIPISFEHLGIKYNGELQRVAGAGSTSVYHLMVNKYYFGRLRFSGKWIFDSTPKMDLSDKAEIFGKQITLMES